jgi:hypothetical protein
MFSKHVVSEMMSMTRGYHGAQPALGFQRGVESRPADVLDWPCSDDLRQEATKGPELPARQPHSLAFGRQYMAALYVKEPRMALNVAIDIGTDATQETLAEKNQHLAAINLVLDRVLNPGTFLKVDASLETPATRLALSSR